MILDPASSGRRLLCLSGLVLVKFPAVVAQNITFEPTFLPSNFSSSFPTVIPPSDIPSLAPTAEPSLEVVSRASSRFRQEFQVGNGRLFTSGELNLISAVYARYTEDFAAEDDVGRINTTCEILNQGPTPGISRSLQSHRVLSRHLQSIDGIRVDYEMSYASFYVNVSQFPNEFQRFVNRDLEGVAIQLSTVGLNVSEVSVASRIVAPAPPTDPPTVSPRPSVSPAPVTVGPTVSFEPSRTPTLVPTQSPSTLEPSAKPSQTPSEAPDDSPGTDGITVVAVSVAVALFIVAVGIFVYYKKRKNGRDLESLDNVGIGRLDPRGSTWEGQNEASYSNQANQAAIFTREDVLDGSDMGMLASPSLVSNRSLLSAGNSMTGDSGDEIDATHNLADEFDQYKDQNLEKMRAGVEGNLSGFDGMMSQALTKALVDEEEAMADPSELLWGGSGPLIGVEIEASALGEVADWLKRKMTPTDEERRLFMQDTLNKMVSSVRHGALGPDEAARSIHECAALLGLRLATDIPVTTLIITGMRKTVTSADVVDAFAEFGEISEAAVASNQRGFGILRFHSDQSVDRAMKRFRTGEIVVQDVAVQLKVLRPGSLTGKSEDDSELTQIGSNAR